MNSITFEPVSLKLTSKDRVGRLAFVDGNLVAVLVRLDDEIHAGQYQGQWHLEALIGLCARTRNPAPFSTLDEAALWLQAVLATDGE